MAGISCIITSYNNGEMLKHAIRSILEQTRPPEELIIADDGSTDGSREYLTILASQDSRVHPILREKNLGVAGNRDLAIREASQELITHIDGDDTAHPEKLEREYESLIKDKADVAFSNIKLLLPHIPEGRIMDTSSFAHTTPRERLRKLVYRIGYLPRDMMMRKELYISVGGMRHVRYEDWDFMIRLAGVPGEWTHAPGVGTIYNRIKDAEGMQRFPLLRQIKVQRERLADNRELISSLIGRTGYINAHRRVLQLIPTVMLRRTARKLIMRIRAK